MKTALVLPVYNEERYISHLIERAKKHVDIVIAVDDGSRDKSFETIQESGAVGLKHIINLGKSSALKTGCEAAIKLGADIIIFMDSDGQHLPEDLPRFIEILEKNEADMVIGSRVGGDKMPFVRKYGNELLKMVVQMLFSVAIKDIQSGYRAFRSEHYQYLNWRSKNYHADAEMTARAGKYGLRCKEIFIDTIYNDPYKGMNIIDGIGLLFNIVTWKFTL